MINNSKALINLFTMVYHSTYPYKIFNDKYSRMIITQEEYKTISDNTSNMIQYFKPNFNESKSETLRFMIDNYLSPTIISRTKYNYDILKNEIRLGCHQYLNIASGYDTTSYMINNKVKVFEVDNKDLINDKINRIHKSNINNENVSYITSNINTNLKLSILNSDYNKNVKTHCSLLGVSYYLNKTELDNLLNDLSSILCEGSSILLDYPTYDNSNTITNLLLTHNNEEANTKYSTTDITSILSNHNLLVFENLTSDDVNQKYFYDYNTLNPNHKIYASKGVNICLAVKKTL